MTKSKKSQKKGSKKSTVPAPKKGATTSSNNFFTNSRSHLILIFFLSIGIYANTLRHDYAQDDAIVIYDNMFVTKGLKGIPGIFAEDTFFGFFKKEGKANLVAGGRYRPFTLMMYALEVQLFAPKKLDTNGQVVKDKDGDVVYDPYQKQGKEGKLNTVKFIGHLVNLLLYGLTGMVLYLVLLQLFPPERKPIYSYFIALVTTLLFIAHPVHTEVVANVKGRDEIMALLGSLAAMYYLFKAYRNDNNIQQIAIAALLFFIALLSKENTITFLGAIPLAFYFFTKASTSKILTLTAPLVAVSVLFIAIRTGVLGGLSLGDASMELLNNPFLKIENNQWVELSASEKLATIFPALGKYIQLLFFPHPLTHDYYPRQIALSTWSDPATFGSLLLYLGLFAYAVRGFFKKDPISFSILFYIGTLSIVSNIFFAVGTNMSERFIFMPSIGFCLIIAILLYRLAQKMNGGVINSFASLHTVMAISGVIILLLSVKTISRNPVWKNNFTLFTTDIAVSQNSAKLQNAVGGELIRMYHDNPNETLRQQKLTEATQHLQKALSIHPTLKNSFLQLGNCYNYLQQYEQSIANYQKVLAMVPDDVDANNNLGITYREAGKFYGEQKGDFAKSMQFLEKAYAINPNEYETLRLLGVVYGVQGRNDKAIEYFTKASNLQPNNADALWNLSSAYFYSGNENKANELRQRAMQIDPEVAQRNQRK